MSPSSRPPKAAHALHARKRTFVRTEIWNAAIDLFAEKGYELTTIEEIAASAGVSRRTFFRYFASKDDVMVQAIDTYGDIIAAAIRDSGRLQDPLEIVRHAALRVAEFVVAQPRARKGMQITERSTAARGAQLSELAVIERRMASEFAASLRADQAGGHTPEILASLTFVLLNRTFKIWYDEAPEEIAETVDEIFAVLVRLTAGAARARSGKSKSRAAKATSPANPRRGHSRTR